MLSIKLAKCAVNTITTYVGRNIATVQPKKAKSRIVIMLEHSKLAIHNIPVTSVTTYRVFTPVVVERISIKSLGVGADFI